MKTTIISLAILAVLGSAGAASAQQTEVGGTAEKYCTLPTSWTVTNNANGASSSQCSGTTWTIPEAVFVTTGVGIDTAMRIRGAGSCNTSHTIRVQSTYGGMTTTTTGAPGFSTRRAVRYDAFWNNGSNAALGPSAILNAATPGQVATVTYTINGGAIPPPGNRDFDIRMTVDRDDATPLVAGTYSDIFTVTLSPTS